MQTLTNNYTFKGESIEYKNPILEMSIPVFSAFFMFFNIGLIYFYISSKNYFMSIIITIILLTAITILLFCIKTKRRTVLEFVNLDGNIIRRYGEWKNE